MTYVEWMAARHLLYEEQMGRYLRAQDNRKSAVYAKGKVGLPRHEE